jgi:hypothetical protein
VLNGRYTTIVISIVLHILILIALVYSSADSKNPSEKPKAKPAIKSYIYRPVKPTTPKTAPIVKPLFKPEPEKKIIKEIKEIKEKLTHVKATPNIKKSNKVNTKIVLPEADKQEGKLLPGPPLPNLLPKASSNLLPKTLPQKKFSAREQLSRLRSSINNSITNDAYKEHTQVRSNSIMHGEPFPVPHSKIQVTEEEKRKKNTSYTGHNTITKNDNGSCTIHREQMLGSPIEATTSGFACGESKFDKNFRQHMKKVRDKVMPQRR